MQKVKFIPLLAYSLVLMLTSCFHKTSCDSRHDEALGEIDYSTDFQNCEIERSVDFLTFSSENTSITLQKSTTPNLEPNRLLDHEICQSLDIKPYTAYAYYEYENLNMVFSEESLLISIEPFIFEENTERKEVIFFTLSPETSESIKASVPIYDAVVGEPLGLQNTQFIFQEQIELNDTLFEDIWVCQQDGNGIYYSKEKGLVAIELNDIIYLKV